MAMANSRRQRHLPIPSNSWMSHWLPSLVKACERNSSSVSTFSSLFSFSCAPSLLRPQSLGVSGLAKKPCLTDSFGLHSTHRAGSHMLFLIYPNPDSIPIQSLCYSADSLRKSSYFQSHTSLHLDRLVSSPRRRLVVATRTDQPRQHLIALGGASRQRNRTDTP